MFEYVLLAFVCGLFALMENGKRSPRTMQMFYFGLFAFLLLVGLRYMHGDYKTYQWGYENGFDVGGDKGYFIIQDFFHNLGFSFQAFVFIITFVSVIAFRQTFRLSIWPCFGLVMILGKIFTLYAMSGIRQYIAMAICWWAISELFLNKRKIIFFVMVLIAASMHGSALIILPVYFLRNYEFTTKRAVVMLIIAMIAASFSMLLFSTAVELSDFVSQRFSPYLRDNSQGGMNLINYAENFLFLYLSYKVRPIAVKRIPHFDFFLYMFIIYCGFLIVGNEIAIVKRLRDYYAIAYAFIVPSFIYLSKESIYKKLAHFGIIAYFIFLMFRSLSVYDAPFSKKVYGRMVPYHSIFEKKFTPTYNDY